MDSLVERFVKSILIRRGQSVTLPAGTTIQPGLGHDQVTVLIAEQSATRGADIKEKKIPRGRVYEVRTRAVVWMPNRFRRATFQVAIPLGQKVQYGPEPQLT